MTQAIATDRWKSFLERDRSCDGVFFVGVRSTGIFCKPSCPARRCKRENAVFFDNAAAAVQAGYRACLRCHPERIEEPADKVEFIQQICQFIEASAEPPSLAELATQFNLSPYHLQRTFKKLLGISPRQYADEHRIKRFKQKLKGGTPVTSALYESGFGSSSSLYERACERLGMTPVHYRSGAFEVEITYSTVSSPLGWVLIARTERGVCGLSIGSSRNELVKWLKQEFPLANVRQDDGDSARYIESILRYLEGKQPHCHLPLDMKATAFQRRVWEELRRIPYGATRSYSEIAQAIGHPAATRAVARACATNPVPLVVPCHRVVRKGGDLGGYRWGARRKKALLDLEKQ